MISVVNQQRPIYPHLCNQIHNRKQQDRLMRRSVRCEGSIPVASSVGPQVSKFFKIGLNHDEPFESGQVQ